MRLNHFESVCQQKLKSDRPIRQIMQVDEREQSESVNTVYVHKYVMSGL